ncbi:MAG: hypothetical protein P1V97_25480 [Planctomycetota bacterium]|nr:hypothetical protein [Planctomycetota bacterium]
MKRTPALIVGLSALGVVTCCVAFSMILVGGAEENKKVLNEFFGDLGEGRGQDAYQRLHPDLQKKIDQVMFEQFALVIKKELGKLTDVTIKQFNKKKNSEGLFLEATARGQFEKGVGELEIKASGTGEGPKLTKFNISSPKLSGWFQLPRDRTLYQARAQSFAEALCTGKAQVAWDLMNGKLRTAVGEAKFTEQVKKTLAYLGPSKEVTLKSSKANGRTLIFTFTIRGQAALEAVITISFPSEFRGEITTYQLKPSKG